MFAINMERRATGDKQPELGAAGEQLRHQWGLGHQVFEVVEQQKCGQAQRILQVSFQSFKRRLASGLPQAQSLCDRRRNQFGIAHRSQGNIIGATRKMVRQHFRYLQAQARFADASGAGKGDQVDVWSKQQFLYRGDFGIASDKRCTRRGKIARTALGPLQWKFRQPVPGGDKVAEQVAGRGVTLLGSFVQAAFNHPAQRRWSLRI